MKKTLIISALLVVGSLSAYSQGTVVFKDGGTDMNIHIYAPQAATPGVEQTGQANSALGVSADIYEQTAANGLTQGVLVTGGSTVYTGGAIGNTRSGNATPAGAYNYNVGSDFTVELYGAAGYNVALGSLAALPQYTSQLRTSSTTGGTFATVSLSSDPGIPSTTGNQATVALYAWYSLGGLTLAQDQAGSGPWGVSPLDNITALGGLGSPASTPEDVLGLQSFSLIAPPVPEPSTIALAVMGASALLFRRRK
jgi:hypothetical protein